MAAATSLMAGKFDLAVQPMVHVASMADSVAFFEAIGGTLVFGSRDGDWSLVKFGETHLSLLARPPSADNPEPVELQFVSRTPLQDVEAYLRKQGDVQIARGTADEAFGRMLQLRTPNGLVVKLLELERDLIE